MDYMTESLDDIARKHELMECMLGQGTHGIIMNDKKAIPYCTLIKCDEDKRPYDCCYRGDNVFTSRVVSSGKVENHYKCMR
jgi:hypothetical protein